MGIAIILIVFCLLLLCVGLLWLTRARERREKLMMERLRGGVLYASLQPMLLACARRKLGRVELRREVVIFYMLQPVGSEQGFDFVREGFDMPRPEVLLAIAQALAEDVPELADPRKYAFRTHQDMLPDGSRIPWYEYEMRPDWKDYQMRG